MDAQFAYETAITNVFFFACGLLLFGAGLNSLLNWVDFIRRAREAKAKVIDIDVIEHVTSRGKRVLYHVIFEFNTPKGIRRKFTRTGWTNEEVGFEKGQEINVLYDPIWPEDPVIKSFMNWAPAVFLFVIGLLVSGAVAIESVLPKL
jgi:hypothetical protein